MADPKIITTDESDLMQIIRITIDGVVYDMYSPILIGNSDDIGTIQEIEFGEFVEMRHVASFLMAFLNRNSNEYGQTLQ